MKEKFIVFLLIFSLTVNVVALITTGYIWGKSETPVEPVFRGGKPPSLVSELPLDNGQRRKMHDLRRSLVEEIFPIRDGLMTKREELVGLLTVETPDLSAIDKKLSEINGLQSKTQHAVIDHLLKEKEFLSPSQQKKYFNLICNRLCPGRCAMGRGPRGRSGRGMGSGRRQGGRMGWE
jgi:Spy/CpxP family protein refolding chaperone